MSDGNRLAPAPGVEPATPATKPTWLELFYDLVFVFAFFNVTTVTAEFFGPATLVGSVLVLALLWFAWGTFAVIGNAVRTDQGIMPLVSFAIMGAIFVTALTMPEAFDDEPPGLPGALVFAAAYFLVRALQVLATRAALRGSPQLRHNWRVLTLPPLFGTALLVIAAIVPQLLFAGRAELVARVCLWLLAIATEYISRMAIRTEGVGVVSVGHWAERHGQIILIALGESIISLGTGPNLTAGLPLTWAILLAVGLGIGVIAGLWWVYFDSLAYVGAQALHRARGTARAKLASTYSYLHLPMIAGIILFSLGLKRALAGIADPAVPTLRDSLDSDVYVLYGGVILYLLSLQRFQVLTMRYIDRFQIVGLLLLVALIPVADWLPSIAALALLTAATVGHIAVVSIRAKDDRQQLRRAVLHEQQELEAREIEWRRQHW